MLPGGRASHSLLRFDRAWTQRALPTSEMSADCAEAAPANSIATRTIAPRVFLPVFPIRYCLAMRTMMKSLSPPIRGRTARLKTIDPPPISGRASNLPNRHALLGQLPLRMLVFGEMRQTHTTQHIGSLGELDVVVADDLDAVAPGVAKV